MGSVGEGGVVVVKGRVFMFVHTGEPFPTIVSPESLHGPPCSRVLWRDKLTNTQTIFDVEQLTGHAFRPLRMTVEGIDWERVGEGHASLKRQYNVRIVCFREKWKERQTDKNSEGRRRDIHFTLYFTLHTDLYLRVKELRYSDNNNNMWNILSASVISIVLEEYDF